MTEQSSPEPVPAESIIAEPILSSPPLIPTAQAAPQPASLSNRQTYNVVSDTVTGANVRYKDNLYQAIAIGVCLLLGAGIGALATYDRLTGAVGGAFCGLLIGLFGSGIFLMVFRAIQHGRGKHD